jgi:hypothetical protein
MSDFQHIPLELIQHILSFLPDGQLSHPSPRTHLSLLDGRCPDQTIHSRCHLPKGPMTQATQETQSIAALSGECEDARSGMGYFARSTQKRQDPLPSELQSLLPCMESIQCHRNVRDQSLLLALVTARSLSGPKTAASARSTIRNLDIAVHLDSISPLEKLFRVQSQWDKLVLRFYWNYWDCEHLSRRHSSSWLTPALHR